MADGSWLKAESSKLKAQSSKLKAQSSKLNSQLSTLPKDFEALIEATLNSQNCIIVLLYYCMIVSLFDPVSSLFEERIYPPDQVVSR
jgi:hypothetical protein